MYMHMNIYTHIIYLYLQIKMVIISLHNNLGDDALRLGKIYNEK
jgi:hypothetical protein